MPGFPAPSADVRAVLPELVRLRRDLHAHPELGFREFRTSALVARRLKALGLEVRTGVAGTGVVGLLRGGRPGPVVMWRADMDALPIQEANRVSYRSRHAGVMHACGHDGHTAIGLMAARVLARERAGLCGAVKFVFQPAEEGPGGARPMIEAGVLRRPDVEAALGLHLWNEFPLGRVGAPDGGILACADRFELTVRGKGGHGAAPHRTVDPIVTAAQIVQALQTITSRNVAPLDSAVVSVCQIAGGSAHNVIPEEVRMVGTLRSFDPALRSRIARRVGQIATGVARSAGARCEYDYQPGYPPTVNHPRIAALVREVAAGVVGTRNVTQDARTLGGEDMAWFLREVPGCFFFVGSANAGRGLAWGHHHPRFDFDERALSLGLEIAVRALRRATGSDGASGSSRARSRV